MFSVKRWSWLRSRIISSENEQFTVRCLVLSNFGKRKYARFTNWFHTDLKTPDGSIIIIIGTDTPLYDWQLKRLAKRSTLGLGRTGSVVENGSGDIAIAFSNANLQSHEYDTPYESHTFLRDDHPLMEKLFQAVVEATEEAIMNSLKYAKTTIGRKARIIEKAPL